MAKFCVFCGKEPNNKNKEHIIPKWLIRLTGDENRKMVLGPDFNKFFRGESDDLKDRNFSFKSFQFPSCTSCNNEYSILENKVSIVIKKMLSNDYLDSLAIDALLNWFDKLRIGLWLGSITLDKIKDEVSPKFYINDRIATKDRCLFIYMLTDTNVKGINFYGFNTPAFQFAPCIVGLRINNMFFINYSKEFLTSKNLGFPYFEPTGFNEDLRLDIYSPFPGKGKLTTPIMKDRFIKPTMAFYQSILNLEKLPEEYITQYVTENSIDLETGKSNIFFYDSLDKKVDKLSNEEEVIIDGILIDNKPHIFHKKITKNVIVALEKIIESREKWKNITYIEENRKMILKVHRQVKNLVFKYI